MKESRQVCTFFYDKKNDFCLYGRSGRSGDTLVLQLATNMPVDAAE
jgi:hypothetical protein